MSSSVPSLHLDNSRRHDDAAVVLSAFWTASRGGQTVNCELVTLGHGQPVLRCGFGPHAIIRSQCLVSADAAAEVSEAWMQALVRQGFHIESRPRQRD